jgi:EAL domain-containing protein (putative c-di-GMP-specific phosphodiesterase class I)
VRQAIVQGILGVCKALKIDVIAEGVETHAELQQLLTLGINLYQGYLFAKPEYETLPKVNWPAPTIG